MGQGKYLRRQQVRVDKDQLYKNPPKVPTLGVKKCLKNPIKQAAAKLNPSEEITFFKKPKKFKVATLVLKLQLSCKKNLFSKIFTNKETKGKHFPKIDNSGSKIK